MTISVPPLLTDNRANASVSTEITKVDEKLIKRMHAIIITVSTGLKMKTEVFRDFILDTAKYFVKLYSWYNMSPTKHKFLIQGPEVINHSLK